MSKPVVFGWIISLAGMALWFYGYFATGNPALIDWQSSTPWWIADYLPNIESEIGMLLVFAGMGLVYCLDPDGQGGCPRSTGAASRHASGSAPSMGKLTRSLSYCSGASDRGIK